MKRANIRRKTPLKAGGKRLRRARPKTSALTGKGRTLKTVIRSDNHRAWIATQPCVLAERVYSTPHGQINHFCSGDVVAMHIRLGTDGGTGFRPSDTYCVPGCQNGAHAEEHRGPQTFARRWGVTKETALEYAARSPFRSELGNL